MFYILSPRKTMKHKTTYLWHAHVLKIFWTKILNIFKWHLTFLCGKGFIGYDLNTPSLQECICPTLEKPHHRFLFEYGGKKGIKEYSQKRYKLVQSSWTMLFTKLYLGVNYLIVLLPIVIPPSLKLGKSFVNIMDITFLL